MKIAYIVHHDVTKNDGVTKKIDGQIREWEYEGHEVRLFCFTYKKGETIIPKLNQYVSSNFIRMRLVKHKLFLEDLDRFSPDLVYCRYDTWSVNLEKILCEYKVILELNTLDLYESKLLFVENKTIKSFFRYIAYKLLRKRVLGRSAGIIGVTREIIQHPSNSNFKKKAVFIANSIDLNNYNIVKGHDKNTSPQSRVGLFFIGTPHQSWHGIDYIKKISLHMPQYDFHIVGCEGEDTKNLYWHGYLEKDDYIRILEKCSICIASLALFRNRMKEACPLKVREYIAYGYPIILGYDDTAFLEFNDLPRWCLKIDCTQELNYTKIEQFVSENVNYILNEEDRRVVDIKRNELRRLQFFKNIVSFS